MIAGSETKARQISDELSFLKKEKGRTVGSALETI